MFKSFKSKKNFWKKNKLMNSTRPACGPRPLNEIPAQGPCHGARGWSPRPRPALWCGFCQWTGGPCLSGVAAWAIGRRGHTVGQGEGEWNSLEWHDTGERGGVGFDGGGRRRRGTSGGRQSGPGVPAAPREVGDELGADRGGKGWLVVTLTENGPAVEQRAGAGEKFKFGKLWPTRRTRWTRRAPVSVRAPSGWLGRSGEAVDVTVAVGLGQTEMETKRRLCLFLREEEKGREMASWSPYRGGGRAGLEGALARAALQSRGAWRATETSGNWQVGPAEKIQFKTSNASNLIWPKHYLPKLEKLE
jgi:hypothetical protein